jgi:hypothetical protein
MGITATTLSAAVAAADTVLGVASATYITAPVSTTGSGLTLLKIDEELLFVVGKSGTQISVLRGQGGTQAKAHAASVPVLVGGPSDYAFFVPALGSVSVSHPERFTAIGPPLTGATIAPSGGRVHHYTGTTQLATITVPADVVAGYEIALIFDGSGSGLTWANSGNIAVAGTSTTAGSAVSFFYDPSSAKWHPSRLA